jgi:hypothetical protein
MSRLIGWIYIQKEGSCDNREGGFVDFFVSAPKFELYCKDGQYPSPVTQMITLRSKHDQLWVTNEQTISNYFCEIEK